MELNESLKVATPLELLKTMQSLQVEFQSFKDNNIKERWKQHEVNKGMLPTLTKIRNMHQTTHSTSDPVNKLCHGKINIIPKLKNRRKFWESSYSSYEGTKDLLHIRENLGSRMGLIGKCANNKLCELELKNQ